MIDLDLVNDNSATAVDGLRRLLGEEAPNAVGEVPNRLVRDEPK